MSRVTGIGGVFFKCKERHQLQLWYERNLGIPAGEFGHSFTWRLLDNQSVGYTVWNPFADDSEYFDPSSKELMINYRVDDLEGLVSSLTENGVELIRGIDHEPNGKFAWIIDPEGNKIELWEPVESSEDPYVPKALQGKRHEHHGIDYIEISVRDVAAAKTFYGAAFGWTFNDYAPTYAGIRGRWGEVGGLTQVEDVSVGGPLLVLFSEDLDETKERVRLAGGVIVKETFAFPGGIRFHFSDPSGNVLAVWSLAPRD